MLSLIYGKVVKLMQKDRITGLPVFEDFLSEAGAIVSDRSRKYLIVAADICDFHYINTNFGYDVGDEVLKDVADVITNFFSSESLLICTRAYSDHFIGLFSCSGYSENQVYEQVVELKYNVAKAILKHVSLISPNLNIGIHYLEDNEENIISAVDKANVARRTGKGNYSIPCVIYSEHLMEIKENSAKILPIFEESFKNEAIRVYLQPKISAETKKLVGAEALSRLVGKDGRIIPPNMFIAALEKTGKIVDLDFYVLRYISKLIHKWIEQGIEPVPISFNLSRLHFFNETIVEDIIAIVNRYKVPPRYIEIEVTESVFFEEADVIIEKVEKLRNFGFKVSVDDFGAGYSSLNLIGILPVDVIKLDKGFVKDSLKTKRGNDIIKGLIGILNDIKLDIVCEGVETTEEERIIKDYGCTDIQGFLYDRPIPVCEFEQKYIS